MQLNQERELHIKKVNLDKFESNSKILVIGKDGIDATATTCNIVRHFLTKYKYDKKIILSSNPVWENFYPIMNCTLLPNFNIVKIEKIWNNHKRSLRADILNIWNNKTEKFPKLLIVMEDYILNDLKYDVIRDLICHSRHYNTTIIIKTQYSQSLSPSLRTCIDYIFMCKENNPTNLKLCYEHYFGLIPTFDIFTDLAEQITQNFSCMGINQRHLSGGTWEQQAEKYVGWFTPIKYKQLRLSDWNYMKLVLDKAPLWSKLHKDLKKYMIKFFYEYAF